PTSSSNTTRHIKHLHAPLSRFGQFIGVHRSHLSFFCLAWNMYWILNMYSLFLSCTVSRRCLKVWRVMVCMVFLASLFFPFCFTSCFIAFLVYIPNNHSF